MRSLTLFVTAAAIAGVLAGGACKRNDVIGTLGCTTSRDCTPPSTICSPDGRCVPGCLGNPTACIPVPNGGTRSTHSANR